MKNTCLLFWFLFVFLIPGDNTYASADTKFSDELAENPLLQKFSDKQKETLFSGKVVFTYNQTEDSQNSMAGNGMAYVLIRHPARANYDMFTVFEKQYLYMPHVVKSDVLEEEENRAIVFKELDFFIVNIRYTHIMTKQPDLFKVSFITDTSGENSVKFNKGYFQFQELTQNCCLFTFALESIETGFRIPNFLKKYLVARDLPAVAENVKKRMESGGAWHK